MGDDDDRHLQVGDEPAEQIEEAGLHGDIEAAGRLIHEDEARTGDQVPGDLQTLAHAAGEAAGILVDAVGCNLDPFEPRQRRLTDATVVPVTHRHQALTDIGAGGDRHAEPVSRVLVDEAPVGAHQEPALGFGQPEEIAEFAVAHAVADRTGRGTEARGEAVEQRRLARAGLADHRQNLARPELKLTSRQPTRAP